MTFQPIRAAVTIAFGLVVILATVLTAASEPSWEKLGDRYVNHSLDRDEIKVSAKDGRFGAIRLHVNRRPVRFKDVKIHFANGEVQNVQLRNRIRPGGDSRVIQLDGDGKRVIEKVVFWYSSQGRGRVQAEVELWGRS